METSHIIYIHGRHSPPTRSDLMTHSTKLPLQQQEGSTNFLWQQPEPLTRYARYHPFGEGHVQARSVLRLAQETEQEKLPQHATEDLQQNPPAPRHPRLDSDTMQNSHNEKCIHSESAPWSARYHPFGEGHGQPARYSDLCRGMSMDCNFWQTRSCRCRFWTRHERAR